MQNNSNNVNQLQILLNQLSNHINKINEIIIQMNIIINQMNLPMINQLNNIMNNHVKNINYLKNMGNDINFNFNFNQNYERDNFQILNPEDIYNITFDHSNGSKFNIIVDKNKTIGELIEIYFKKVGKPEIINNYINKYFFECNSQNLNNYKEKKIKDMLVN